MSCTCTSTERYKIKLVDTIKHNDETYSFDFHSDDIKEWGEGDNSKLYVDIKGQELGKKFSYATLPNESIIRFTTRIKEERSEYKNQLSKLNIGDTIKITEPQGNFNLQREGRPVVLLSNGVGIAASRSLIKAFEDNSSGIPAVIQINVDAKGTIYKSEFDELMKTNIGFSSHYVSHRAEFYNRLDHEIQSVLSSNEKDPYIYIVGSNGFVHDSITHLKTVGFSDEDIKTDGHISEDESCGCSTTEGCGCGSNYTPSFVPMENYILPVVNG